MLMLYNAVGRPEPCPRAAPSPTCPPADYYYTALSWAQEAGLASGTGDGAFSPTASITREQAFTILRQALPLLGKECPDASLSVLDQFADKDLIADYALGSTPPPWWPRAWWAARGHGIDPRGSLTRAEMAVLLYKAITYTPIGGRCPLMPGSPQSRRSPPTQANTLLTLDHDRPSIAELRGERRAHRHSLPRR